VKASRLEHLVELGTLTLQVGSLQRPQHPCFRRNLGRQDNNAESPGKGGLGGTDYLWGQT